MTGAMGQIFVVPTIMYVSIQIQSFQIHSIMVERNVRFRIGRYTLHTVCIIYIQNLCCFMYTRSKGTLCF